MVTKYLIYFIIFSTQSAFTLDPWVGPVCWPLCLVLVWRWRASQCEPLSSHLAQAQGLEQITSDIKHMAAVRKRGRERKGEREKKTHTQKKRKTEWICQRAPSYLPSQSPALCLEPLFFSLSLSPKIQVACDSTEKIVSSCLSGCRSHRFLIGHYPSIKSISACSRARYLWGDRGRRRYDIWSLLCIQMQGPFYKTMCHFL